MKCSMTSDNHSTATHMLLLENWLLVSAVRSRLRRLSLIWLTTIFSLSKNIVAKSSISGSRLLSMTKTLTSLAISSSWDDHNLALACVSRPLSTMPLTSPLSSTIVLTMSSTLTLLTTLTVQGWQLFLRLIFTMFTHRDCILSAKRYGGDVGSNKMRSFSILSTHSSKTLVGTRLKSAVPAEDIPRFTLIVSAALSTSEASATWGEQRIAIRCFRTFPSPWHSLPPEVSWSRFPTLLSWSPFKGIVPPKTEMLSAVWKSFSASMPRSPSRSSFVR